MKDRKDLNKTLTALDRSLYSLLNGRSRLARLVGNAKLEESEGNFNVQPSGPNVCVMRIQILVVRDFHPEKGTWPLMLKLATITLNVKYGPRNGLLRRNTRLYTTCH